jgi:hypothetical protein
MESSVKSDFDAFLTKYINFLKTLIIGIITHLCFLIFN